MILGIDISKKSLGWAVMDRHERLIKAGLIKNPDAQATGQHLSRISDHITYLISRYGIKDVVIEDLFIQFIAVGKDLFQIHGLIKAAVFKALSEEVVLYHQAQWRSTLGIKSLSKAEKAALIPEAKRVKGDRYKTYHKYLCDIKHRVVAYVNLRINSQFTYEENDITDAIGLILAHGDRNAFSEA